MMCEEQPSQWHIFLSAVKPQPLYAVHHAIYNEGYKDTIDDMGLIPESVTLNSVSFYFTGTFSEACTAAEEMCEKLNSNDELSESTWEFEEGSIMLAE